MGFILHNDYHIIKTFTTERGAKIALARKYKAIYPNAIIEDHITFNKNEPMVETYNILNPKAGTFLIRKSQKGGCCDPAMESYHSM